VYVLLKKKNKKSKSKKKEKNLFFKESDVGVKMKVECGGDKVHPMFFPSK
jgi:hypothetical protein